MGKIKIGILGCGRVAGCHFEAIRRNGRRMELAAVADADPKNLARAVEMTGAAGYPSLSRMLAAERLDLAAICTPNWLHYRNAREVIASGASVIVEKPLSLAYAEGEKLMKLAREKRARVFLIQQNRFNPTVRMARRAIDAGAFGKIYMMSANVFWNRGEEYYKKSPWHGSKKFDGGAFVTQGSHYTDIMDWFAGAEPARAYAAGATLARKIETEDTGAAVIEWKNGTIGTIGITVLAYPGNYEGSLTILGEKGLARIGGTALNKITDWKFARKVPGFSDVSYETESVYGFGHAEYYRAVADTMLKGKEFLVTEREALQSLRLLTGIVKSMETGRPVRF